MVSPIARLLTTTALCAPIALLPATAAMAATTEIGIVGAVNPAMEGTPPTQSKRVLKLGANIIQNERVQTSQNGSGQLIFNDQTTLTVAPQSDLVLDEYVYDPGSQSGEIAVSLSKGVLRFIGGRITKKTEARVRTPVATVGIRGGLALVIVDPNGRTRVCHLAGEYSHVRPDAGGDIYLSRPNACAVIGSEGGSFGGLIKAAELQEIYEQLEGRGDGGLQRAVAAPADTVARVNSEIRGGEAAEPVSTSGESSPTDRSTRDERQPDQDDGIRVVTVNNPPPAAPPPAGPALTGLGGGAVTPPTFTPFLQVFIGSLIGVNGTEEITFPVPGTGSTEGSFNTSGIVSQQGLTNLTALNNGAELFEFTEGDGANSTSLGGIDGIGLFDDGQQFLYAEFIPSNDPEADTNLASGGFAVIGDPTPFQGQFFGDDATIILNPINESSSGGDLPPKLTPGLGAPNGTEPTTPTGGNVVNVINVDVALLTPFTAVINPELGDPAILRLGEVNTVEGFVFEPNIFFDGTPPKGQLPLFMIGNQGMARFESAQVGVPGGLTGGGKWLSGALYIGDSEAAGSGQQSHLFVLADDIESQTQNSGLPLSSGPQLATTVIGTESFDNRGDDGPLGLAVFNIELGTFEDAQGNTMFGTDPAAAGQGAGAYLVLSTLSRSEDGVDTANGPGLEFQTGTVFELTANTSLTGESTTNYISDQFADEPTVNLLTRDDTLTEVVTNPLSLAGERIASGYDVSFNEFQSGFATGIASCEGSNCGQLPSNNTQATGNYAVAGNFSLNFDSALDFDFTPANELDANFSVFLNDTGDLLGPRAGGDEQLFFTAGGDGSAFIDDNRFGIASSNVTGFLGESSRTLTMDVALASSGLVGDGGIFASDVDVNHDFLRWGWWSASYQPDVDPNNPGADRRTDVVHLGNWVTGISANSFDDLIPTNAVGEYNGFAVGTMVNHTDGVRTIVGGTFDLTFTFQGGSATSGVASINIPDAGINERIGVTSFGFDNLSYQGSQTEFDTNDAPLQSIDVQGTFFSDGGSIESRGDPTVATGGAFDHNNFQTNTQTVGVFGGDRVGDLEVPR